MLNKHLAVSSVHIKCLSLLDLALLCPLIQPISSFPSDTGGFPSLSLPIAKLYVSVLVQTERWTFSCMRFVPFPKYSQFSPPISHLPFL